MEHNRKRIGFIALGGILVSIAIIAALVFFVNPQNPVDRLAEEVATDLTPADPATPAPTANPEEDAEPAVSPALYEEIASIVPLEAMEVTAVRFEEDNPQDWWKFFRLQSEQAGYDLPESLQEGFTYQGIAHATFGIEGELEGGEDSYHATGRALILHTPGEARGLRQALMDEIRAGLDDVSESNPWGNATFLSVATDDFLVVSDSAEVDTIMRDHVYDDSTGEPREDMLEGSFATSERYEELTRIPGSLTYMDFQAFYDHYLLALDNPAADEALDSLLPILTGWQEDTVFIGVSEDYGMSWSGVFLEGGFDTDLVDLPAAQEMIAESLSFTPDGTVADQGLFAVLDTLSAAHLSHDADGDRAVILTGSFPLARDINTYVEADLDIENGFRSSVAVQLQTWEALFYDMEVSESIAYLNLEVTEQDSARLSYHFYEDIRRGSAEEESVTSE